MTKYFITVGMSLLTSSRCWNGLEGLDQYTSEELRKFGFLSQHPEILFLLREAETIRSNLLKELNNCQNFEGQSRDAITQHKKRIITLWRTGRIGTFPAELATMYKIRTGLTNNDHLYFLHGEGDNQKVAWLLRAICEVLKTEGLNFSDASLLGPYDWDPVRTSDFTEQMGRAWEAIKNGVQDGDHRFILTGGYKAIVIDLTNRISRAGRETKIYYLHEDVSEDVVETQVHADGGTETQKTRDVYQGLL